METQKIQRPLLVTMFCSFYFVYWAISIVAFIAALLMSIGAQFPSFIDILKQINIIFLGTQVNDVSIVTAFIAVGFVAGTVGYWFYQKWSVIVYTASSLALFIVVLPATSVVATKLMYSGVILYIIASLFALNIAMIVVGIMNFKRMK